MNINSFVYLYNICIIKLSVATGIYNAYFVLLWYQTYDEDAFTKRTPVLTGKHIEMLWLRAK